MSKPFDPYYHWLSISPKHRPPNYYQLLGIELWEDDPDVIDQAAERQIAHVRRQALGRHVELSQRILNELAQARRCLLQPESRQAYDLQLRERLATREKSEGARPAPPPPPRSAAVAPVAAAVQEIHLPAPELRPVLGKQAKKPKIRQRPPWLMSGLARWLAAAAVLGVFIGVLASVAPDRLGRLPDDGASSQTASPESSQGGADKEPIAAGQAAGQQRSDNGLNMTLCWCPPGTFTMGSPPSEPGRDGDEDQSQVLLSQGFWLGKYEVTQSQWREVMGTSLAEQQEKSDLDLGLAGTGDDYPMYYVSHAEASQFCEKFTERERQAGRLPSGWEYHLPTEAQWEYACRAGTTTATAFGDSLSSYQANFDGNYPYNGGQVGPDVGGAVAAGTYSPNSWGLCDMHGNVWEWCRDGYREQLPQGADPVNNDMSVAYHVFRGGGWEYFGRMCRCANRERGFSGHRSSSLGFRIAMTVVEQ